MDDTPPREGYKRHRNRTPRPNGTYTAKHRNLGEPARQWRPEYVGKFGYPKTPEEFAQRCAASAARLAKLRAEGRLSRRGIPDGWGRRREELIEVRAKARAEAKQIIKHMVEKNIIGEPDDVRAEVALEAVVEIVRAKDDKGQYAYPVRDRISAANTVLNFTKQKPAQKTDLSVRRAEDFLNAVAEEALGKD